MNCNNCGKQLQLNQKICSNCGASISSEITKSSNSTDEKKEKNVAKKFNINTVITALVVIFLFGVGIYNNLDEDSIEKNNEALSSFDSGDSQSAIEDFNKAKEAAVTDETKIVTLVNLGYVYATEGQNENALDSFNEALKLIKKNTYDYYLVSGEIALLEEKLDLALENYEKAYNLKPNEVQVNNALSLFYLDLDEIAPEYMDYEKALNHAQKAYKFDPEKSEVSKQNLALAYLFNDEYDQTISLLSTTNLDQHPYMAFWLGIAYLAEEDFDSAEKYFQKALDGGAELPEEVHEFIDSN